MQENRWSIIGNKTVWNIKENDIHTDTIEMSGNRVSAIVTYGVNDEGKLLLHRELRYPTLRIRPRDTHSTLASVHDEMQSFVIDGKAAAEIPYCFELDGTFTALTRDEDGKVSIRRTIFPCRETQAYMEHAVITNVSGSEISLSCPAVDKIEWKSGTKGRYPTEVHGSAIEKKLLPGESVTTDLVFSSRICTEALPTPDALYEIERRCEYIKEVADDTLVLESGDKKLDMMFRFSKIRTAESIFDTASGPLHSPGGGAYYAAIWTNDQIEYAAPFFAYLGYDRAVEATDNAFELFLPFMGEDMKCIPSSIIDEGFDYWNGAGDRGDSAMYLYGVTRFILGTGRRDLAEKYWDAIKWCVKYCRTQIDEHGVILSDSDELEGRFPSGKANLCTSTLAYGGLISAADVARELGHEEEREEFLAFAKSLHENINTFFGANVSGYDAYRYYEENDKLRSWICIPLTMGIFERRDGTIAALLSDKLFGKDGLVCEEGNATYWDRSTLYALRGILNAGHSDEVWDFIKYYVNNRLLTEHVPYAIEAYPEGNKRHLAAESALFARIVTEGMFGFVPTGYDSFTLTPSVPRELGEVKLKKLHACGHTCDITVKRSDGGYSTTVTTPDGMTRVYETAEREKIEVTL